MFKGILNYDSIFLAAKTKKVRFFLTQSFLKIKFRLSKLKVLVKKKTFDKLRNSISNFVFKLSFLTNLKTSQ
jgi:hypothetical protein